MIPHAKYAFDWDEAGGRFFNVCDAAGSVYTNGSSINEKTVDKLGLPKVESAEDEEAMIRQMNLLSLYRKEGA